MSRNHLSIKVQGPELVVSNLGRSRLLHDGLPTEQAAVSPGEVLQLGSTLLLLCTRRPYELPRVRLGEHPFGTPDSFGIVGESPAAWTLRQQIVDAGSQDAHALVQGPSGAGKELVAQGIHRSSFRSGKRLVARNAATFPEQLIDAELFGNAANYPNPGMRPRPGLIGEANGSTLYLDEIGELPDAMQAHLLRVLDEGEYQRLGESQARRADLRFVGATRRSDDRLRHDLIGRLRVRVRAPGLDERRDDVPLLVRYLLGRITGGLLQRFTDEHGHVRMSPALARQLVQHDYTMHVRELESLLRQSATQSPGNFLDALRLEHDTATPAAPTDPSALPPEVVQEALDRHGGKQSAVWRELGLSSRHALARLIKKYGLHTSK